AGVPACEFWRRPAASWNVGIHRCLCSLHRDGAGTRSRGRLRYIGADRLRIVRATAETRVDRIHQRVVATAMQIFIVTVEMFVGFALPERNNLRRQPFVDFVRGEGFPTMQDVARPDHEIGATFALQVRKHSARMKASDEMVWALRVRHGRNAGVLARRPRLRVPAASRRQLECWDSSLPLFLAPRRCWNSQPGTAALRCHGSRSRSPLRPLSLRMMSRADFLERNSSHLHFACDLIVFFLPRID